jgi:ferredoxin-nitrate reductase
VNPTATTWKTGAPLTKHEHEVLNPRGRAILKAADYLPVIKGPDDEYPLQLSTGRLVYHFHTRTKTGRSKELEDVASAPRVEISGADAGALNVEEGVRVTIRSRRGAVQMPATITKIAKGPIFIPFHYGYFDASNNIARAANELTQGE